MPDAPFWSVAPLLAMITGVIALGLTLVSKTSAPARYLGSSSLLAGVAGLLVALFGYWRAQGQLSIGVDSYYVDRSVRQAGVNGGLSLIGLVTCCLALRRSRPRRP